MMAHRLYVGSGLALLLSGCGWLSPVEPRPSGVAGTAPITVQIRGQNPVAAPLRPEPGDIWAPPPSIRVGTPNRSAREGQGPR